MLVIVVGLNTLAFFHAWGMTHFTTEGRRTPKPEQLSRGERARVLLTGVRIPRPALTITAEEVATGCTIVASDRADGSRLEGWWVPAEGAQQGESSGTVVLFHGYAASRQTLVKQAREFATFGWNALLVDFPGSGGSSGQSTSIGYHEAREVAAALDELLPDDARARPIVLYGMSMGSAAILRAVGTHGVEVDGIVIETVFAELLGTVSNRFEMIGLPAFPLAHLLTFWGGVQQGFWGFSHNPSAYAAQVRCPVLLMAGERDQRVTLTESMRLAEGMKCEKKLVVFTGAGHVPLLEADPTLWRKAVAEFLAERISSRSTDDL